MLDPKLSQFGFVPLQRGDGFVALHGSVIPQHQTFERNH